MNIIGKCLNGRAFQAFWEHYYQKIDTLFPEANGISLFDLVDSMLPGQKELGWEHLDFEKRQNKIAFAAVKIYDKWEGIEKVKHWRIIHIIPELEPIFLRECGNQLFDKPLGENELYAPEADEEE